MNQIVFASQNENKVKEIRSQIGDQVEILSLNDIKHIDELAEDQSTLEGNALQKARFVKEVLGYDCFADDTGLEIEALNGEPGVYSARYAGEAKDANANMEKVLKGLEGKPNRKASFRTVISLIIGEEEFTFEGICKGEIITEKRGEGGFGYDPIFRPDGFSETFAQMNLQEKAKIGHRGLAVQKLITFLNQSKW